MKKFKFLIFFYIAIFFLQLNGFSQANPSIAVLPLNSGLVSLGSTLDLEITVGNTGVSNIAAIKLRPVITVPALINILPNIQQTGLPPGWSIVSNTGSQIRICNGADVIGGFSSRTIFIKVQGVALGGPTLFSGQINFANGINCASSGISVAGNYTADDFSTSTVRVIPGCNLGIDATAGTILCNGGTTTVSVTASAATGPVEYSITGGTPYQTSNLFNNVVAGTYTASVREVNNPLTCVASTVVNINEPPQIPVPYVNILQPTCTVTNGIVKVTSAINGLIFSLDGTMFSEYPTGGYLLSSGSYNLIAKNTNNCLSPTTIFTVDPQPLTPTTPVIGTVTQPNSNLPTGSIELNNLPAGSWIIEPGIIAGNTNSATLNNLAAGSYKFSVTNVAGCSSLPTTTVDVIAVVGAPDVPIVVLSQPTCSMVTGTIFITPATTDLTFSLDGGAFVIYPAGGFTGILSGTHYLVAQNTSGCLSPFSNLTINEQPASPTLPIVSVTHPDCTVSTGTIAVSSITTGLTFSLDGGPFASYPEGGYITASGVHSLAVQNLSRCAPTSTDNIVVNVQPATPSLTSDFTPIDCFGGSSVLTVTATGGVLPYEYNINAGGFQNANVFTIGAGSFSVAVKDLNGCFGKSDSIVITQPTAIATTVSATTIACNGDKATLSVLATGGLGTYEYTLNNGTYQSNNTFNVLAGIYTVQARLKDNPACSTTVNTILNVVQPGILKASATAKPIEYCGGNTLVNISVTGGIPPYRNADNFVKGPGKWDFVVFDSNGCVASAEVFVFPPGCLDLKVFPNPSTNTITINHSASVGAPSYLQIFSENGSKVLTHNVPRNSFITILTISKLASGNYFIVYINGDEKRETKFVKINN